ncbi:MULTISPECIES: hypothetical protein [unclassified Streptomyces]|uniref:hypothetical protein n=1 Tax=unclassified Streptomyces TaxID=2593676 RepID=UPI00109E7063|nr:hypothetical protein [Streptomyces sp. A1136]THA54608.1 hypothetical protein E6R62_15630 [Streptomyces sp. A1136]
MGSFVWSVRVGVFAVITLALALCLSVAGGAQAAGTYRADGSGAHVQVDLGAIGSVLGSVTIPEDDRWN